MHVVVTGAQGFVARALSDRILKGAVDLLTLADLSFPEAPPEPGVRRLSGDLADQATVARIFETPVDVLYHLASLPAGASERDYDLSRRVNLDATLLLLEAARAQTARGGKPPVFVFSSSIAVLGGAFGEKVDDSTPPHPSLTYGAQKLIGELWVEDYTRRGWIDGRSVRLAGVVARPPQRTGQLSAFMSDVIREPAAGRAFVCPVSAKARCWLSSSPCVVDNLLRAAALSPEELGATRAWTLPALHASMAGIVEAVAEVFNPEARRLVSYDPDPALEANFGRYPPLFTPAADRLGFRHDGDLKTLVKQALSLDA